MKKLLVVCVFLYGLVITNAYADEEAKDDGTTVHGTVGSDDLKDNATTHKKETVYPSEKGNSGAHQTNQKGYLVDEHGTPLERHPDETKQ